MKKISVFLSSSMTGELNAERESLKTLFSSDPILKEFYDFYSIDEHASPREIQEAYIDEVKEKDIFLLLLNEDLRPAVYEEYNTALKKKKTFFCYIKANSPNRNPELVKFIDCEIYKHHPAHYSDTQDLWKRVNNDFKSDLTRSYFNKLDDSVNEEKVEYVKYRASTADSIYRYFPLEELIKISKQEKILNLTVDQLIALSYSSLKDSGNYKLAILFLEVGLLKNPENWILYNNRGQILDEIGLSNNAIFSYNKAIQYNPKSDTAYYNLGNNYFSIGKYDKALSCYFKALDIDPNKGNATSGISSCYLRLEDVANSLIWSQRAYDMLKDEISITNLALTFSLNNQPDKALNLLNELKSNTLRYKNVKAYILKQSGKYEEAISIIDQLLKMGALEYSIAVVKFYCLVELGKENEAEKWVGEIEKRYPINPIDYNNFGYKLANKFGKSEYANILYKKALELDSTFMNAWTNLQYNLNLLGRKEQGLDACNEALKINPYEPISIRNKYLFLLELNRIDEMTKFIFEKSFGVFGGKINDEEHDELMANAYKGLGFNNKEHFETILKIFRNLK